MNPISKIFFFLLFSLIASLTQGKPKIEIYGLTTEYKVDPIGVGVERPRFSWKISSDVRNTIQLSYRIIVAANEQDLKREENLLWDAGIVKTSQSIHINYNQLGYYIHLLIVADKC